MSSSLCAVRAARALLASVTPLKTDCGRLCGGACCQGDEETGMLLFPGEEALYAGCTFGRVLPAGFSLGGHAASLFVCRGSCPRESRPLACRLFPLFLTFPGGGGVSRIRLDTRARFLCPLCDYGLQALDPAFVSAARRAYDVLLENEASKAYLLALDASLRL